MQTTNLILLAISAIIIYGYINFEVRRLYGTLKSISDSVYYVHPYAKFAVTMMSFPIPFMIAAISVAQNWTGEFSAFFAGSLIVLVGVANCYYKGNKEEEIIHVIGATGGIFFGMVYIFSFLYWYYIVLIFLFLLFVLYCHFVSKYDFYKSYLWKELQIAKLNKFELFLIKCPRVHNHTWVIEEIAITFLFLVVLRQILL